MAVLKQRKIDGERCILQDTWTDQYFFIERKSSAFICSEKKLSVPSVDHLVKNMKCQTSH